MRRANNQDSFACLPAETEERFNSRGHLFVVADGMGAHAAGELASEIATEKIAMHYFRSNDSSSADALRAAVREANAEIHQRGQSNPEFHNMGTTASSLALLPDGAVIAHVGDSRVYRLRQGVLEQMTFDHSLVWEMEASGSDSSIWGQQIPKNVITRSLGPNESVEIDVEGPFELMPGDCFLICSDGLTGLVEDVEIGTLMDCLTEEQAVRVLVDLANLRGGPDNTTVIIVRINDDTSSGSKTAPRSKNSPAPPSASVALFATTLICLIGASVLAFREMWGPMIVAMILGVIAAAFSIAQIVKNRNANPPLPPSSGGKAPYRRYNAKPTGELYDRLGGTVNALRDAASEKNWMMDWQRVEKYQRRGDRAVKAKDFKEAIRYQAKAIIETMNQLREQNNRAANETAIDY